MKVLSFSDRGFQETTGDVKLRPRIPAKLPETGSPQTSILLLNVSRKDRACKRSFCNALSQVEGEDIATMLPSDGEINECQREVLLMFFQESVRLMILLLLFFRRGNELDTNRNWSRLRTNLYLYDAYISVQKISTSHALSPKSMT